MSEIMAYFTVLFSWQSSAQLFIFAVIIQAGSMESFACAQVNENSLMKLKRGCICSNTTEAIKIFADIGSQEQSDLNGRADGQDYYRP